MRLKELTNEEFKNFVSNYSDETYYQTAEYGFIMNDEEFDSLFLGLVMDNKILCASLILKKDKYAYAPKGFLIDYSNIELLNTFTKEIKKYLFKNGVIALKISPNILKDDTNTFNNLISAGFKHLGYNDKFESLIPRYEAVLDINMPYYILFKNIKKEFKTKIRGAEKLGIKVYKGSINDLDYLYSHTFNKEKKEKKFFINVLNFFKDNAEIYYTKLDTVKYLRLCNKNLQNQEIIVNNLNRELMTNKSILKTKMDNDLILNKFKSNLIKANKLISNYPDGLVLSSILILKREKTIYVLTDGYDQKFKSFNSKHLLMWKLIEKYSNLGYEKFNLGGIINPNIKDNHYKGLNEFKLSFNSNIVEYMGDFELITNKALYLLKKK